MTERGRGEIVDFGELIERIAGTYEGMPGEDFVEVWNNIFPDDPIIYEDDCYFWKIVAKEKQMRPLEVAICKGCYTWYDGVFIEIPDDTPVDQIARVASEITLAHPCCQGEDISHVFVYNYMEDNRPEKS